MIQRCTQTLRFAFCLLGLSLASCSVIGQSLTGKNSGQPAASAKAAIVSTVPAVSKNPTSADKAFPRYDHIFIITEENKSYDQIMGSADAPAINQLAKTYGLATRFYGEVHPSEANYVAMLGGSTFGIHDDDAYYCQAGSSKPFCSNAQRSDYANHTISSRSLLNQLEEKGLTWKGYFESIPAPGSGAIVSPSAVQAYYAAKHNGFMNFKVAQDDPNLSRKSVGLNQLTADLQNGQVPNYSHIVLNQCHEMHGLVECRGTQQLIRTADELLGQLVRQITHSSIWSSGNNAIVITWDEDSGSSPDPQGCCGYDPNSAANFGGGHIPTIVITSHGPRGKIDDTPYNHYSLLRTTEDAFGIYEYLNQAGNTEAGVKPMTALFAISKK